MPKKRYDLEDRTFTFTKNVILFCKNVPSTTVNIVFTKQVIRSAGSIGANYLEANDSLGKKDFLMHIKICRKEAKETLYWLQLIMASNDLVHQEAGKVLVQEATELKKIFSAIIIKIQTP